MPRGTVILVPGLLGNELRIPGLSRDGDLAWLSVPVMAYLGFEALALPTADRPGVPKPGQRVIVGFPLESLYRFCIQYLQLRDWEVVPVQFDWRRDIFSSAVILTDRIRTLSEDEPVYIIAHSRGGLVVRQSLGMLSADERPERVRRVIAVGVPHVGAITAVATLGDCSAWIQKLRFGLRLATPWVSPLDWSDRVSTLLRSWPGLYSLLPDPVRSGLAASTIDAIYDPASYSPDGIDPYLPHLVSARVAWSNVPDVFPSVEWVDCVGVGIDTLAGLTLPLDLDRRRGYAIGNGDGTVSTGSAGFTGRVRITCPSSHDALLRDGRLLERIHAALLDMPVFDQTIGGGVSR